MTGIWFFKSDDRDTVAVYQDDPAPKWDTEKAETGETPSLPPQNLSLVKAYTDNATSLFLPDDHLIIYFNHNSHEISDKYMEKLNRLAKIMNNKEETKILIKIRNHQNTGYWDCCSRIKILAKLDRFFQLFLVICYDRRIYLYSSSRCHVNTFLKLFF